MGAVMDERWVCVRLDARGLWTADLCEGDIVIKNLGGSYPKSNSVVLDVRKTWGRDLKVKILPKGIVTVGRIDEP
jgi:hypothetical protein